MKRLWMLPALPFAAVAFVWLGGILLGPHYTVSASRKVEATPEAICAVLEAVENYPGWRSDIANVEVAQRKPYLKWMEYDNRGRVSTYTDEGSVTPGKWISRIMAGTLPMRASRTFLIVATEDGGTEIAVKEEGDIKNPLERFQYRFQTGYSVALERYLEDLRKRLGE